MKTKIALLLAIVTAFAFVSCATSLPEVEHGYLEPVSISLGPSDYDLKKAAAPAKEDPVYNSTQDKSYDTLQRALDLSEANDVIVLREDITVSVLQQIRHPLTLDLNGHTIENEVQGICTLLIREGSKVIEGTVTVKNGTLKGRPTGNGTNSLLVCVDVDKVVLDDLVVTSCVSNGQTTAAAALYFNGVRNAQVNNCTVTGKVIAYQRKANSTSIGLTINGGTFVKDPGVGEGFILRTAGDSGSNKGFVKINGAVFTGNIEDGNFASITINSGTWSTDVSAYVPETSSIAKEGDVWKITTNE